MAIPTDLHVEVGTRVLQSALQLAKGGALAQDPSKHRFNTNHHLVIEAARFCSAWLHTQPSAGKLCLCLSLPVCVYGSLQAMLCVCGCVCVWPPPASAGYLKHQFVGDRQLMQVVVCTMIPLWASR